MTRIVTDVKNTFLNILKISAGFLPNNIQHTELPLKCEAPCLSKRSDKSRSEDLDLLDQKIKKIR